MAGQFGDADVTALVGTGEAEPTGTQLLHVGGVRAVVAALESAVRAIAPSWPTREQASGTISSAPPPSLSYGVFSACTALPSPHTDRAYSSSMCWKPPQVPRKGMPPSLAVRMAASAPASLR
ncbi:hypothetical protein GCM10010449_29390 [Streptomyces rectiviolaceus]|uniref:Uncharacterized protein n=1 Tax=Streptomyces rectiviolaceus TaxID=332591 RepID=A0ABP6ME13_9ACTN